MSIELRILTGARGGHHERFDKRVVTIGRHLESDLRFDPNEDLDVSSRHAEIVAGTDGTYRIRDRASTNGTFVNGLRIAGEETLTDGDVIWLGAEGPQIEVQILGARAAAGSQIPRTAVRSSGPRVSTGERVKVAVRRETAGMRRVLTASLVLLLAAVGAAYWMGHREARSQVNELMQLLARSDSTAADLQARLAAFGDTTFASALRQQDAELAQRVPVLRWHRLFEPADAGRRQLVGQAHGGGHIEASVRVDEDLDTLANSLADPFDDGHGLQGILGRVAGRIAR